MSTGQRSLLKNWHWFAIGLVAITIVFFFANVPYVEAQSSSRLSLLQSDTSRIVLELNVSGYDSRDVSVSGGTYTLYSIGDLGHTAEPGKPQLPLKGTMVGIPPGAQATLRILDDQSQTVSAPRHPLPAPTERPQIDPRRPLSNTVSATYTPNPSTYSANQYYPAAAAKIGATGDWRSQHYVTVQFYPLQYNPATRQLLLHRRLRVEITLSYPRGQSPQTVGSALNQGAFEPALQNAIINYSSAKNWRTKPTAAPARRASPRTLSGEWYRIGVNVDGIYKVTCGQLAAAKGTSLSIDPSTVQLFKQVYTTPIESAIKVVNAGGWGSCTSGDSSDYIEFFGLGATGKYTDTNVYWLTYGVTGGKRMTARDGTGGGGTLASTFTKTVHLEQNLFYRSYIPLTEDADHWYWTLFYCPPSYPYPCSTIPAVTQADYSLSIDNPATGSYSGSLQIDMQGYTSGSHQTQIAINGTQITDTTWTGPAEHLATIPFNQSLLMPLTNTIHISEPTALSGAQAFLNYLNVTYLGAFSTTTDILRFQQPVSNTWQYQINGYITSTLETFDITDLSNVQMITASVTGGGPYTAQFTDPITSPHEYFVLASAQRRTPTSVVSDTISDLRNTSNGADYIIISHSSFMTNSQLLQLASTRATQFSRVKLVDVQDVYDEFNDGLVDPQAIHDFLQYAYTNWQSPAPSYVLLVGAGTFDPRGYCIPSCNQGTNNELITPANSTLIPPYLKMVDPDVVVGETVTDNCLVAFSGTCSLLSHPMPDMFIGRLPADTNSDVTALVTKILNYENPPVGKWRYTSAFVTDNAFSPSGVLNDGGNFFAFSEEIAGNPTYYPSGLLKDRIYYNPCTDTVSYPQCALPFPSYRYCSSGSCLDDPGGTPNVHDTIISSINDGRLIVNYIGHGAIQLWAELNFLNNTDLSSLSNGNKTPVMLELTCNTGYFIYAHPSVPSLAKVNVNLSGRGAVASWAATGRGLVGGHDILEKGFFDAVMNQNTRRLGPAITAGKANLNSSGSDTGMIDTTLLLGDPASKLAVQFPYYFPLIFK